MLQLTLFDPGLDDASTQVSNELPLAEKIEITVKNLKSLLIDGYIFTCATSFGKDSSVCLSAVIRLIWQTGLL